MYAIPAVAVPVHDVDPDRPVQIAVAQDLQRHDDPRPGGREVVHDGLVLEHLDESTVFADTVVYLLYALALT
jgi:hypothetical protein